MKIGQPCTDLDCERSYLSACIRRPDELDRAPLSPADLSEPTHAVLLRSLLDLRESGTAWTLTSLETELKELRVLERVGGYAEVVAIASIVATRAPADARRLRGLARARRVWLSATAAAESAAAGHLEDAREHLTCGLDGAIVDDAPRAVSAGELAQRVWSAATSPRERAKRRALSGMGLLDWAIGGFVDGSMTVVGGRTGAGKSSLMLAWALSMARAGRKPGIISLEDPADVWGGRLVAALSGVDSTRLGRGEADEVDLPAVAAAVEAARALHLEVTFAVGGLLERVRGDVQHLVRDRGCDVIFVDYLQAVRLNANSRRYDKEVSNVAKALKGDCARERVPLVLGSQLSRAERGKPFSEPHLSDLKESGDVENESEAVVLLWRENDTEDGAELGKIAKVKDGPRRPRFQLVRGQGGMVEDVERHEPITREVPTSKLYTRGTQRMNGSDF